jgi:hypothetical protein
MTMLNGAKYRIKDQNVYSAANVADGSKADVTLLNFDVCFTPESRHRLSALECPLWVISRLMHRSKDTTQNAPRDEPVDWEGEYW